MTLHRTFEIPCSSGALVLGRHPLVMGIINVTPDSFSDGGDNFTLVSAIEAARVMVTEGADILDVGGESTRPGGEPVSVREELDRVMPVIDALVASKLGVPISIDTRKALVADQAVQAGASIINDVEGALHDPEIADVAALHKTPFIAMHWDRDRNASTDMIAEMRRRFDMSLDVLRRSGVPDEQIVLDPGFGFRKSFEENYILLNRLAELNGFGFPLLIGTSRKSMFGRLLDVPPKERVSATLSSNVIAYLAGGHIFRVHDVRENREALAVAEATLYGAPKPKA
jgi:dihydropteroate synthase